MDKSTPLVSVITGYYNRTENLKECIQSILDQTYEDIEYIIFDDCSTDGTSELLSEIKDNRIKLVRHDINWGFTKGLIHAISLANGEFIAIHGAGDVSSRERIAKQVDVLVKNQDVGIVGCLIEDVSPQGTIIHTPVDEFGAITHFSHGEVMYRKNLYYRVGGYNALSRYGQFTNLKREICKISKPSFVNEVLYKRIHFTNGVTKNDKKKIEQLIFIDLGTQIANIGILNVDLSAIVIRNTVRNIKILTVGSDQENYFITHAKKREVFIYHLYKLYRNRVISADIFKAFSLYMISDWKTRVIMFNKTFIKKVK